MQKFTGLLFIVLLAMLPMDGLFAQWASSNQSVPEEEHESHDHEHQGRIVAGGALSFWADLKDKGLSFHFHPEVGYLFNDSWGAGVLLGYEYARKGAGAMLVTEHAFKIAPFARYYYYHKGPFNLYLDGGFGFNFSREVSGLESERVTGFEVGIRPGACVDLTEGLCLCLRMGFLGYRNEFFMGEEPHMGETGFGVLFAPEELMIGLELEI